MITDCLEACQNNDSCSSVNYETGLCVLFSSNADRLPGKSMKWDVAIYNGSERELKCHQHYLRIK